MNAGASRQAFYVQNEWTGGRGFTVKHGRRRMGCMCMCAYVACTDDGAGKLRAGAHRFGTSERAGKK